MKKIICLLLVTVILMSSSITFAREYLNPYKFMEDVFRFDIGDFTAEVDGSIEADESDLNAIQLLSTLGIWDDVNKPVNSLLTKTEFSIIMSNLRLGPQNALKGVYAQKENVNEEKATYKDAYEHLLEALGYYYRCAQFGNTDEALLIVASDIGLIADKPENVNSYITRGELAKLINKAIKIEICSVEYNDGGYSYSVAEGKTLLNTIHDIYEVGGFVNAIPDLAVYGNSDVRDGYIQIDRKNVKTNSDLSEFLGSRVTAYAEYNEMLDEYTIIYIDYEDDYKVIEVDFADITDVNSQYISYMNENGEENDIIIDNFYYVTENGDKLNAVPSNMSYYTSNEGKIIFTASQKHGDIDTAIIYKYNYFVVGYVDTNNFKIGLQFNQEYDGNEFIQLDDKVSNRIIIDGAESDYSRLTIGTTIRYFKCNATGYSEIIAQSRKVKGEVVGLIDDFVTIAEQNYRLSKDFLNIVERGKNDQSIADIERVKGIELGLSTTFYVFDDVLVGYTNSQVYKWGYLRGVAKSRTAIDPDITLGVLSEDNEWIELRISDKFELDGKTGTTKEEFVEKINSNPSIMHNIIRYKTGKVDEIVSLDTIEITPYEQDNGDDIEKCYEGKVPMFWTKEWLGYDCPYRLSSSTVLFIVPVGEEDNKEKVKVAKVSVLPETGQPDTYHPMKLYTPNQYNIVGAAVYTKDLSTYSSSSNSGAAFYVESIKSVVLNAADQEYGYKITGKTFVSSAIEANGGHLENAYYILTEDMMDINDVKPGEEGYDNNLKIETGDVIMVNNAGEKVTSWSMAMKYGMVPPLASETEDPDDFDLIKASGTWKCTGVGVVKAVDTTSNIILLEVDGTEQAILMRVKTAIDYTNKKIQLISIADFYPGDKVYINAIYGVASFVIKNL
ncbi:MAG: hypothetical protein J6A69_01315 [Clostridia bacterium]|nr:hypothetical protein [Clostridia bacterium]